MVTNMNLTFFKLISKNKYLFENRSQKWQIIGRCGIVSSSHFDRKAEVGSISHRLNFFNVLSLLCDNSVIRDKDYGYVAEY